MVQYFSNPTVRSIHARLYNPPNLSRVTLIVDGKDISVHLQKINNELRKRRSGRSNLISRKLRWKNAGKQQLLMDIRGMTLAISDTKGANEIYVGHQLKEIFSTWDKDIEKIFDPKLDCLIMDNHFTSQKNL